VEAADSNGSSALHLAARNGHTAVVQLLLGARAGGDATDAESRTTLPNMGKLQWCSCCWVPVGAVDARGQRSTAQGSTQ